MIKLDSVTFSYEHGDETFTVHTRRSIRSDLVSLNISTEGDVFTASLESSDEITITELTAVFRFGYCETDRIFLNGYQSWTDSYEHTIQDTEHGCDAGKRFRQKDSGRGPETTASADRSPDHLCRVRKLSVRIFSALSGNGCVIRETGCCSFK